jgi:hypothetical protein
VTGEARIDQNTTMRIWLAQMLTSACAKNSLHAIDQVCPIVGRQKATPDIEGTFTNLFVSQAPYDSALHRGRGAQLTGGTAL